MVRFKKEPKRISVYVPTCNHFEVNIYHPNKREILDCSTNEYITIDRRKLLVANTAKYSVGLPKEIRSSLLKEIGVVAIKDFKKSSSSKKGTNGKKSANRSTNTISNKKKPKKGGTNSTGPHYK